MPKYTITIETDKKEELEEILGRREGAAIARVYAQFEESMIMMTGEREIREACISYFEGNADLALEILSGVANLMRSRSEAEINITAKTMLRAVYDKVKELMNAINNNQPQALRICCEAVPEAGQCQ
jgi:hypothetical protein